MPQEDEENRRPPRGLNLAEKHIHKHLPDTPQMLKLLKEDGKAHVFNDRETLLLVTEALFEDGQLIGTVRGHERYGMYFDRAIGYRIDLEGNRLPLYFAEMKIIKGEYHVIPRTKPSEVI
ncbi:hypothetical protein TUMEXPCC7403_03480 [Tumidithrix helvetica PCC 7403]|uniref:DUF6972 family protein n=1 Tax=Tumidithrix helvetica TaxID=3457545 RepID=UPI003C8F0FDA